MNAQTNGEQTSVLLIRIWHDNGFRARLSQIDEGVPTVSLGTSADPEEVVTLVRAWLDEFLAR